MRSIDRIPHGVTSQPRVAHSAATSGRRESLVTSDIRESMRVLPAFLQPFLTWLTGKPLRGETPTKLTPLHHVAGAFLSLLFGVATSVTAVAFTGGWLVLLVPGWILTVHGARKLQVMILHHCSHYRVFGSKPGDTYLGRAIAAVLLIQSFDEYRREHIDDHHSARHMTRRDPSVEFLLQVVGLRAGMPLAQLWRRLLIALISPAFHARFLAVRLASLVGPAPWQHKVGTGAFLGLLLAAVAVTHSWTVFLVAYVFPLTILYQVSAALRLSVKHTFPERGTDAVRSRAVLASFTNAVFLGEPAPQPGAPLHRQISAWARWAFLMVFVHLFARTFVLVGDTVCHDFHHRHPQEDWANYIFARQADIEAGHAGWPAYTEVWGLRAALNAVLASLSNADIRQFQVAAGRGPSAVELVSGIME